MRKIGVVGAMFFAVGLLIGPGPALARAEAVTPTSRAVAIDGRLHVPVLMYHRIHDAPPDARLPELWVAPERFRAQLRMLADHGWRTITAGDLARAVRAGRSVGPKRFVITFDDGARDGYGQAKPIMERFDMRGTYCVVPGRSGRPWQISKSQLVELHDAGHEIANHSWSHADLTHLSHRALRREIGRAAGEIERIVGERPATVCYPYGHHDWHVRRMVARTGHLSAYTTVDGAAEPWSTRLRWPRIRVNGSTSPAELLSLVRPYASGGGAEPRSLALATIRRTLVCAALALRAGHAAASAPGSGG